jgi:cyclopropane fatty-acyl-phospholipid synthase-like methyltransferase
MRLSRPHYESDVTQFIKNLKAERPELEAAQVEGRLRLWDKPPISLEEQERRNKMRVAQKPYVYHNG